MLRSLQLVCLNSPGEWMIAVNTQVGKRRYNNGLAVRLLDSMSYLRGAVMKVGQTLANFPDIVPREFIETLDRLYYEAPPMHWSLQREMASNELGDDPEAVFASFEKRAFAAASLGQVHRARLKTGEEVAVKIQYPGIARTIREDFRNFFLYLLPGRLGKDWENIKDQFDELRMRLERETDYEAEAAVLAKVRPLFREDDGIVVPRVYPQHSTFRVLTMERLDGGATVEGFVFYDQMSAPGARRFGTTAWCCQCSLCLAFSTNSGRTSFARPVTPPAASVRRYSPSMRSSVRPVSGFSNWLSNREGPIILRSSSAVAGPRWITGTLRMLLPSRISSRDARSRKSCLRLS